jgi:hypothetical protein
MSEFDEELKKKRKQEEDEAYYKQNTIDDDAPDLEKEDEYGQSRLHCWILM